MKFLIIFLLSSILYAKDSLQEFLDIDRFHAYTQSWSQTMKKREKAEIAEVIGKLTPKEIADFGFSSDKLQDAFHYDDLIYQYLQKKHPQIPIVREDVSWGYDFYKRKLNEAYQLNSPSSFKPKTSSVVELKSAKDAATALEALDSSEVLLNVDGYVANRMTRGVFWEASVNQRPIELHVGTAADFKEDLARRGAKVIGEVKTEARNYNPIYLVQDPGAETYHYAITEISGQDRVKHLSMQSALVRWEASKGKLAPPPPVSVVGDAVALLEKERATLTQVLRTIPKADQVVIGQKGAFERTFGSMAKASAVMELVQKNPAALNGILTPAQLKLVTKLKDNPETLVTQVMKEASSWDKIYEASEVLFDQNNISRAADFTVFNLDRGSYEVSDYLLKTPDGKTERWRIFSNSWGDEILPAAHALKDTGHTKITYIGTAGSLDPSIKVGDLIIPEEAIDSTGVKRSLTPSLVPEGAKKISAVTNVASPFEETKPWLEEQKKVAQAVEVETGHLSRVFNSPDDRVTTLLLISDAVGVEGETLAEAQSSVRRNAQIRAISTIIDSTGGKPTAALLHTPLSKIVEELIPSRDPLYKFHIQRIAQLKDVENLPNPRGAIEEIIAKTPSFTTSKIETALSSSGEKLSDILTKLDDLGIIPTLSLHDDLMNGTWNPKNPLKIHLRITDETSLKEAKSLLDELIKKDKSLSKLLSVEISSALPNPSFITLHQTSKDPSLLFHLYKDSALGFGGLATTQTRSGGLKFVQVASPQNGRAVTTPAYFQPGDETARLLSQFEEVSDGAKILLKKIEDINESYIGSPIRFVLKEASDIPGGNLAQIVPVFPRPEKLEVTLYISKEGLKNPAVILEEMIHLDQIGGKQSVSLADASTKSFYNPNHWAETVVNAQSGSPAALRKIAEMELQAAISAQNTLSDYSSSRLFQQKDNDLLNNYIQKRKQDAEALYKKATQEHKRSLKIQTAEWETQKAKFPALEAQTEKLNHLIARNDRAGVAKLLEDYLPWPLMEPTEKKAWSTWIESIRNPDPSNRELIFRGLDGETILRNAQGEPYLMSTVLTKNQGNYTRRLRSLTTMREKIGVDTLYWPIKNDIPHSSGNVTLSTMMLNHASDPKGSPFLSASNNDVAKRFGNMKRSALLVDKNRIFLNFQAYGYKSEFERLIPLVVFPDEILYLEEFDYINDHTYVSIDNAKFIKAVEEKLGRSLLPHELDAYPGGEGQFMEDGSVQARKLFLDPDVLPKVGACSIQGNLNNCNCIFTTLNNMLK
jgi:hypothetical protein